MADLTWGRIFKSPVIVFTIVVTGLVAALAAIPDPALWFKIMVAVITAIGGTFGVYPRVTPVNDPMDNEGNLLTPAG